MLGGLDITRKASCCLNLNIPTKRNTMSAPYCDWYITNTIIFLLRDQDLLEPRKRGHVFSAPLRAFPMANVDVLLLSPPPQNLHNVGFIVRMKMNLFCLNNKMKDTSQF